MTPEQIVENYDKLKSARAVWESHWQEIADFVLPEKNNVTRKNIDGEKKGQKLYDSTAPQSLELLAGALHGMLTNPSSIFFELSTGDKILDSNDSVRKWLQDAAEVMHGKLNNSNFQTEIHEVYIDLAGFGTSVIDTLEDDEKDVRFATRMIAEVVVEENNRGIIDKYYRGFSWNARQIVMEFGYDNCPKIIQDAYDKNVTDLFEIVHAIYPREMDKVPQAIQGAPKGYKIGSKYVLKAEKAELEESGFREMPTAIPRWMKTSNESYGRSPAMKALPDIKMLNEMKKAVIRSAQKTIDPPLMCPDDGFIMPLKMTPSAINYYRSGTQDRIEPIQTNARIDIGNELIQETKQAIQEAFYIDQLQLNQGPQMTATEVQQRTEEKMRLLGPMLGRQQSELLAPLIERVFSILFRKKRFSDLPMELKGQNIHVRYCSLIAKAQRTSEAQNINRTIEAISPLVQTSPEVLDNFDADKIARWSAQIYGMPQDLLRDKNDMKKLRDGRNQARQQAIQQNNEQHQADLAAKAIPAMAKGKQAGVI